LASIASGIEAAPSLRRSGFPKRSVRETNDNYEIAMQRQHHEGIQQNPIPKKGVCLLFLNSLPWQASTKFCLPYAILPTHLMRGQEQYEAH
jgi:hypothetical protein